MVGKLKADRAEKRDQLEQAMAILCGLLVDADEISLRIQQATRRSSVVGDVLIPAQERMIELRSSLRQVQARLSDLWADGQSRRWASVGSEIQQQLNSSSTANPPWGRAVAEKTPIHDA